jgi:hypothetical protein
MGCHTITNEYLPDVHHIEGFNNVPELRKMLVHTIRQILRKNELPNEETVKDYYEKTRVAYFKKKLEKISEKKPSKYAKLIDTSVEGSA